jgi:hypothetical protein
MLELAVARQVDLIIEYLGLGGAHGGDQLRGIAAEQGGVPVPQVEIEVADLQVPAPQSQPEELRYLVVLELPEQAVVERDLPGEECSPGVSAGSISSRRRR